MCEDNQTMLNSQACESAVALISSQQYEPHTQTCRQKENWGHVLHRKPYRRMARGQSAHKKCWPLHSIDNSSVDDEVRLVVQEPPVRLQNSRHVHFNPDPPSVHEIKPYSEIYGIHPRDFVFDRGFHMIPAYHSIPVDVFYKQASSYKEDSEQESDSSDDDNEWVVVRQSSFI